jgi:hypothetical protein
VVVALKKDGLVLFPANLPAAPTSSLKNDKLSEGFGDKLGVCLVDALNRPGGCSGIPTKTLVAGEKVWIRVIQLAKDSIQVEVVTDAYDDGRYFGIIKFPVSKGTIPAPDDGVKMISEVLEAQQAQDQAAQPAQDQGGQQSADTPGPATPNPAQGGPPPPIAGQYLAPGGSHLLLLADGSFTKFVGGGQGQGQYTVDGDNLTFTFTSTGFAQKFKIQGVNLVDVNTLQVWARTGDAPEAAPAPMQEIAPPPPPTDTPPPTIAIGQTMNQVTAGFGQPLRVANLGGKVIFYYKDMKVTFTNGKVSNVE